MCDLKANLPSPTDGGLYLPVTFNYGFDHLAGHV